MTDHDPFTGQPSDDFHERMSAAAYPAGAGDTRPVIGGPVDRPPAGELEGDEFLVETDGTSGIVPVAPGLMSGLRDPGPVVTEPDVDDGPLSWKNLALHALAHLSPSEHPELFVELHKLAAQDNQHAVIWAVLSDQDGWWVEARNVADGDVLLGSVRGDSSDRATQLAKLFAAAAGHLVIDDEGSPL